MKTLRFALMTLILVLLCSLAVAQQAEPYYGEMAMIVSEFHAQLREAGHQIANLQAQIKMLQSENEALKKECGKKCEKKEEAK